MKIITSGGFQGVADAQGKVIVPAVYEKLGWSNGENEIINQNIGYYENGKWGLINIKTKKILGARFHVLEPFNLDYFEAGKTVPYSNVLKRGLIDATGEVILDFHFYSISDLDHGRFAVATYENGSLSFGVFSSDNMPIIPCNYASVGSVGDLLVASNLQKKQRVFNRNGTLLVNDWVDHVSLLEDGYAIQKDGYFGKLDKSGEMLFSTRYKSVAPVHEFNNWEIKSLTTLELPGTRMECDSISYQESDDLLIAHVNQADHLLAAGSTLFQDQQNALKHIGNGFIVTKNASLQTWAIHKTDGREVIAGFDSIAVDSTYFYALSRSGWDVYNLFGRKINEYPFQAVGPSQFRNIPVKRNDYWGWIDFQGEELVNYRYEKIISAKKYRHFIAKNYHKWGVNTLDDEWVIMPEFDSLYAFNNFYIGLKNRASYVFAQDGALVHSIPFEIIPGSYLQLGNDGKIGAVTNKGYYIHPLYDEIEEIGRAHV